MYEEALGCGWFGLVWVRTTARSVLCDVLLFSPSLLRVFCFPSSCVLLLFCLHAVMDYGLPCHTSCAHSIPTGTERRTGPCCAVHRPPPIAARPLFIYAVDPLGMCLTAPAGGETGVATGDRAERPRPALEGRRVRIGQVSMMCVGGGRKGRGRTERQNLRPFHCRPTPLDARSARIIYHIAGPPRARAARCVRAGDTRQAGEPRARTRTRARVAI